MIAKTYSLERKQPQLFGHYRSLEEAKEAAHYYQKHHNEILDVFEHENDESIPVAIWYFVKNDWILLDTHEVKVVIKKRKYIKKEVRNHEDESQ